MEQNQLQFLQMSRKNFYVVCNQNKPFSRSLSHFSIIEALRKRTLLRKITHLQ